MKMKALTKEQAIIVSGYTLILMCGFAELHEDIERRLGRQVWTHQIPSLSEEIKEAYREDFMSLVPEYVK